MGRMCRSFVQSILKFVNSMTGMVGIAMILYGVWLIRVWQKRLDESPFDDDSDYGVPWFIYSFLGLGVALCVILCAGHIAAETANGCCLYLYMIFIFLLALLEATLFAEIFLNKDWEEDFPEDPSGSFYELKEFIKSNFDICKWIGVSIISVQGVSFLLAMLLKALGPHRYYDSDDDFDAAGAPLLPHSGHSPLKYVVGEPIYGSRIKAWSIRANR